MAIGFLVKNKATLKGGVTIGASSEHIKKADRKSTDFVIGTINTVTTANISVADTTVGATDIAIPNNPVTINDDVLFTGMHCVAGSVVARFYNPSGGNIAAGTVTIPWLHIKY